MKHKKLNRRIEGMAGIDRVPQVRQVSGNYAMSDLNAGFNYKAQVQMTFVNMNWGLSVWQVGFPTRRALPCAFFLKATFHHTQDSISEQDSFEARKIREGEYHV